LIFILKNNRYGGDYMLCNPVDLDIEVVLKRIQNDELILQPSFQRGEVWSVQKKKRLIDTILRGWKIPPIHAIRTDEYKDEVLDGQQRLVAIKEFLENKISIDGTILPYDEEISKLNGIKYKELQDNVRRRFNRYSLTIITLMDYKPEEPAELFFRLNQPATLTSAERRNAYISTPRNQIKELVERLEKNKEISELIGFSNSRLAYDEIISKFCYTLEINTLKKKITSGDLSDKYRDGKPFEDSVISRTEEILDKLVNCLEMGRGIFSNKVKLNKATLFSWMIFIHKKLDELSLEKIGELIFQFEEYRNYIKGSNKSSSYRQFELFTPEWYNKYPFMGNLALTFNQRASMGSTDALSIIYRDIILKLFEAIYFDKDNETIYLFKKLYNENSNVAYCLDGINNQLKWGESL
jgi:hypothetical protein